MEGLGGVPWSSVVGWVAFTFFFGAGALVAWTAVDLLRRARPRIDRGVRTAIGHPEGPEWATGEWPCARCRSVNLAAASRCAKCRGRREEVELRFAPPGREPDVIPAEIRAGPGSLVLLEHDAAAHRRSLNGHWLMRVNGVVVGSAATRDGALQLLRALRDVPVVMADPKGEGYAAYPTELLAAAFAGPQLPYTGPCPEQTRR
jgi:hypothetical protein